MTDQPRDVPYWKLPPGVSRGTWDYVHSPRIADDYDAYFEFNDLFEFDVQVVKQAFQKHLGGSDALIADLGAGTARALIPFLRLGYRGIAIDLSQRMLEIAAAKAAADHLPLQCVRANLVQLDAIRDATVDGAMCLFSTLGMVRGHENRAEVLRHVRRILRKDGVFVLHVHNYWYNLYDPGGPWWLIRNYLRSLTDRDLERGDKFYPYRNVRQMFLHVFTRGELNRELKRAGFTQREFLPLHHTRQRALKHPWLLSSLRANGWMIVCR